MLRVKSLNAYYDKMQVLHNIDLSIDKGEKVGVFGHNGAGKTTLLRSIVGDLVSIKGDISYNNNKIKRNESHHNVGFGIGFVQQGNNVFRELTVQQNLSIAGLKNNSKEYDYVVELFPLFKERSEQIAGSLSGGQQQMLALGMALMTEPSMLLLDEPTTGLAPVIVRDVLAALSKIHQSRGMMIIIVEQNVHATLENVDRAIVLKSGRIIYDGASSQLLEQESLWDLF